MGSLMGGITNLLLAVVAGSVFLADICLPTPIAAGVIYILVVFIGVGHRNPRMIYHLGGLAVLLTIVGFFLPSIPPDAIDALINRLLSIGAIVIVTVMLGELRKKQDALLVASEALKAANTVIARERGAALAASKAKSSFLALANHEMRTPLNIIVGYSELLLDSEAPIERSLVQDYAAQIVQAGHRLVKIVTDMLSLSRHSIGSSELNMEPVDVVAAVRECAGKVRAASPGARIDIDAPPDLPAISGDRRLLDRSLLAVIENAVKFSPEGSLTRVRVGAVADRIQVVVTDQGIGMAPDLIERLGTAFLQEDD